MMNRRPVATAASYYHLPYATNSFAHGQYHDPAFLSVGYRPLHLPLQQQQHSAEHLSLAGFQDPGFQLLQQPSVHQHSLPVRTRLQHRRAAQEAMAHPQQSEEQLAELQKLSNAWEPEVIGPLVGPREPSTKITTEYASADPVYQVKTAALPQKYSHYRTVRGDGKCGWRAVGFGYFEALIRSDDSTKFLFEEARLRSMSNVFTAAGIDSMVYEDFADEALGLLRRIYDAAHTGDATEILFEAFNDETVQNYIITYLKLITTAWMKTNAGDYAPWIENGQTVDEYCDHSIMPIGAEIESAGLAPLKDVLLSPAGIALEVHYLDRSPTDAGDIQNYYFGPASQPTVGTVRLLYRPGHYDILYKNEDFPQQVTTYLQFANPDHQDYVQNIAGCDFMTAIPGGSIINPHQAWLSGSCYGNSVSDISATPAPIQQCVQRTPAAVHAPSVIVHQQLQPQTLYIPAPPQQLITPPTELPQELVIRTLPQVSLAQAGLHGQGAGPFRASPWQYEDGLMQATSRMPLQTTIFRNSHFNTAHFNNPDFQPEEWKPDDDYVTTTSKGFRHRNG
ncbi:hypothetical protein BAUCODRAFT_410942 [Baudoinia panamericana UAMH 10762]|uniref:ubiquitinyl hydrolase 1 n=1 Tax=Baudoinia panamericana (strain UAMH 10762) TaxID=717646 RepID=M2NFL2_BAUPA|nr:uncharacterized protein BAUCODRAFT_410942 [Baudoinia panamericana UAMH 10762]EMC98024.1 hypothetical protein BAUCODRAFT_410942 [Baudoinia panamericana UAMH 10762]